MCKRLLKCQRNDQCTTDWMDDWLNQSMNGWRNERKNEAWINNWMVQRFSKWSRDQMERIYDCLIDWLIEWMNEWMEWNEMKWNETKWNEMNEWTKEGRNEGRKEWRKEGRNFAEVPLLSATSSQHLISGLLFLWPTSALSCLLLSATSSVASAVPLS